MRVHHIIMSGSTILALLIPGCFIPKDLDAYVPLGCLPAIQSFIADHTDYVLCPKNLPAVEEATDAYVSDGPRK
jgi:hypothetical protein